MTYTHLIDEGTVIAAHANAAEQFDALAKRLTDGYDVIWDAINGDRTIRVHGGKFCVSEALVLAAFLPDDERKVVLDDVRGNLRDVLYDEAQAKYYERRVEADECAGDAARDAWIDDRLTGDRS